MQCVLEWLLQNENNTAWFLKGCPANFIVLANLIKIESKQWKVKPIRAHNTAEGVSSWMSRVQVAGRAPTPGGVSTEAHTVLGRSAKWIKKKKTATNHSFLYPRISLGVNSIYTYMGLSNFLPIREGGTVWGNTFHLGSPHHWQSLLATQGTGGSCTINL